LSADTTTWDILILSEMFIRNEVQLRTEIGDNWPKVTLVIRQMIHLRKRLVLRRELFPKHETMLNVQRARECFEFLEIEDLD